MKKVHILYRRHYTDFDIAKDIPVATSEHRVTLEDKAVSLNARRSERERTEEVHYHVSHDTVPLLV